MQRLAFILSAPDKCAKGGGPPLSPENTALIEELEKLAGCPAHIVFVTKETKFSGRDKDIKMETIKAERPRVVRELAAIDPEFTFLLGKVPLSCALNKGSETLDAHRRAPIQVEDIPGQVYVLDGLARVAAQSGIAKWLKLDMMAAINGYNATKWGLYSIAFPPGYAVDTRCTALSWPRYDWDEAPPWVADLKPGDMIGFDLETYPGLSPWEDNARIRMAMVSPYPDLAHVVQLPYDSSMPKWLEDLLADNSTVKAGSNIAFDYKWCARFGYEVNNMWDTSVAQHIIDENDPNTGLKFLTFRYLPRLGDYSRKHRELVKSRTAKGEPDRWDLVEDWEQYDYAAADAEASIAAAMAQADLIAQEDLTQAWKLTKDLYPILAEMQAVGSCVDLEAIERLDAAYNVHLGELRRRICGVLGPINPGSPKQLVPALIEHVPDIKLSKNIVTQWWEGRWDDDDEKVSTQRAILEREAHKHPVIADILEFRKWDKLHGTYIKGVKEKHLTHHGGQYFVHASYNQNRVDTNRLSSSNPNKQNIPRKPEEDENYNPDLNVKQIFKSRFPGGHIMEADFSQAELRVAAMESADTNLLAAVHSGQDLHEATAALVAGVPVEEVTKEQRQAAKAINFGIIFGMRERSLSKRIGVSKIKARGMIRDYFRTFPGLELHIEQVHDEVRHNLKVRSPFGFERRFVEPPMPETVKPCKECHGAGCSACAGHGDNRWDQWDAWRIQRQAYNMIVQNTAACITFVSIINLYWKMRRAGMRSVLFGTVHDSILLDVFPGEERALAELVRETLENPGTEHYGVTLTVPMSVDIEMGTNWGNKKSLDKE